MNLAFVINNNYTGQFLVTLNSIKVNTKANLINVYILYNDLNSSSKELINKYASNTNININYIEVNKDIFSNLPKMRDDTNMTAYFKLAIFDNLNYLDKVLYLDCDIIVNDDIERLYYYDAKTLISAVIDSKINNLIDHKNKLGIPNDKSYINTGVLLIDFKYYKLKYNYIEYIEKYNDNIIWHDQDIINGVYFDSITYLDSSYNKLVISLNPLKVFDINKALVIHYANWKPWNNNYIGLKKGLYKKYYKLISNEYMINFYNKNNLIKQISFFLSLIRRKLCKKS